MRLRRRPAAALLSGFAARADEKAKTTAAAAAAPALSPQHLAKLNRLKALPQADAKLTLASGNLVYPPQPWTRECKAWVTMP